MQRLAAFECLTGSNRPAIGGSGSGKADVKTLEASPACQHGLIIALRPPSSRVTLLGKRRLNERGAASDLASSLGLLAVWGSFDGRTASVFGIMPHCYATGSLRVNVDAQNATS